MAANIDEAYSAANPSRRRGLNQKSMLTMTLETLESQTPKWARYSTAYSTSTFEIPSEWESETPDRFRWTRV